MTITLAAVYAPIGLQGGLTGALFREFAFTLAGAVIISGVVALTLSPMMGSRLLRAGDTEQGFAGLINRRFDRVRDALRAPARRAACSTARSSSRSGRIVVAPDRPVLHVLGEGARADGGPERRLRRHPGGAERDARPDEALRGEGLRRLPLDAGGREHLPAHDAQRRLRRHGHQALERAQEEHAAAPARGAAGLSHIPGVRVISLVPPALPGGGNFPVDFVIASTAEPEQLVEFANQLVGKAYAERHLHVRRLGPEVRPAADGGRLRPRQAALAGRRPLAGRAATSRRSSAATTSTASAIQGRSYKVIPQIQRAERLTPDQLEEIYVTGAGGKLVPLSTFASLKTTTEPRELKRFQQLNAVRIQGVIPPGVSLDAALKFLEDEAQEDPAAGFHASTTPASRGSCAARAGNFLGTFLLSAILIYLVLAGQFESFRDPFIILAGSVPLALSGALLFSFLGLTTLNIYSQVGLITLVGLVAEERHPDRRVRQQAPGEGQGQARRPSSRPRRRGFARSS